MEKRRIKSALEIAMEKIAGMPGLTPEEVTKQKEREYRPIGEAIAKKYLARAVREADLAIELGKYRDDEGQIVRRAFASSLCRSIDLRDAAGSRRAMQGIELLAGANSRFEEAKKEFEEIFSEFEQKTQQRYTIFETMEKERLRGLGITGSAVRPNVREQADWQQEWSRIRQAYDLRLDKLRKTLMQRAQVT